MEERNRVRKSETGSGPVAFCQKPGPIIPAHRLASRPDAFGHNPDQAVQIRPGSVLRNVIHAFFGKNGAETDAVSRIRHINTIRPNSGCTLAVMLITGRK